MNLDEIKMTPLLETLRLENIDDAIYFSERYSGYISNSRLGLINPEQGGSPQKYFEGFAANKIYSDSLIFGSAVHELSLQPESFYVESAIDRPTAKVGFMADLIFDMCIKNNTCEITDKMFTDAAVEVDYYHGILNETKMIDLRERIIPYVRKRLDYTPISVTKTPIFLDPKNREKLGACINSLEVNQEIQNLLHPKGLLEDPVSFNEQTILLDVQVEIKGLESPFIVRLKSKLDNFTIDAENNTITVNDVKTTSRYISKFRAGALMDYHYYREMGMYSYLLSLCAKKFYNLENPIIKSNFLVIETFPNFISGVIPMSRDLFLKGFNEFRDLVKTVAYYTAFPNEIESECMSL